MKSEELIERLYKANALAKYHADLVNADIASPELTSLILKNLATLTDVSAEVKPTEYWGCKEDSIDQKADLERYLAGVYSVVEANSFEQMCLWERFTAKHTKSNWEEIGMGHSICIGRHDDKPVCITIMRANIFYKGVIFLDATSQVVDHAMIDMWIEENMPDSARGVNGRVRRSNAMNFHNALPPKPQVEEDIL